MAVSDAQDDKAGAPTKAESLALHHKSNPGSGWRTRLDCWRRRRAAADSSIDRR